jgi:hypothetical protein
MWEMLTKQEQIELVVDVLLPDDNSQEGIA